MFKFVYHKIFNHVNSFEMIASLTQKAMFLIIFMCPYAYVKRIERCKDYLAAAIRRGVVICVILQEPDREPITEAEKRNRELTEQAIRILIEIGVHVSYRKKIHEKVAIFDEIYICDGSLNFLSQSNTSERMNMFESPEMVREAIQFHNIRCDVCASIRGTDNPIELLRITLIKQRKSLGLSKDKLAEISDVSRGTIAALESGKATIGVQNLDKLCRTLGFVIRCVPNYMTPVVDKRMHEFYSNPIDRKFMNVPEAAGGAAVLGVSVNERRRLFLLTQLELSGKAGVKRPKINEFERHGANIELQSLDSLCRNLDMSVRLVPISLVKKTDDDLRDASATAIAHALRMYEGLLELMNSYRTARLLRLGRGTERITRSAELVLPPTRPVNIESNPQFKGH